MLTLAGLPRTCALIMLCVILMARASTGQTYQWTPRAPAAQNPQPIVAYDSMRRVVVMLTQEHFTQNGQTVQVGATWEWDGATWSRRTTTGPTARYRSAMAFDSHRGVCVLFGGDDGLVTSFGDTWEWNGTSWTLRATTGPPPRSAHSLVFDSFRGVTVLYGGSRASDLLGDTWEWDGANWSQRPGSGPAPRCWHGMAYDAQRHTAVVFGGYSGSPGTHPPFADTWEWDGTIWMQRSTNGPPGRVGPAMIFDAQTGVTVLFGGSDNNPNGSTLFAETWEWNGTVWTQRTVDGPSGRELAAAVYDSDRATVEVVDGYGPQGTQSAYLSEIWEWNGAAWTSRFAAPPARHSDAVCFDTRRGVAVLFGGWDSMFRRFQDTREWNGVTWELRATDGPPASYGHSLAFDSQRGRAVLFGGDAGTGTWEWDGAAWAQRATTGPPSRSGAAMAYDTTRGVTVLFGGSGFSLYGDTWEWNGSTWLQRSVAGPPARSSHALAYDSSRGVTVLFGGNSGGTRLSDTWEWDGSAWTQRTAAGPAPRDGHAMAFDSARGVTRLFGGENGTDSFDDLWEWDGANWSPLSVQGPLRRSYMGMAYDPARAATLLFGGQGTNNAQLSDTWELEPSCPVILASPRPQSTCLPGHPGFSVDAGGAGPLTYQWQLGTDTGPWTTLGDDLVPLPCGGFAHASPPDGPSTSIGVVPCAGVNQYRVRCLITNSCGSATSNEAALTINTSDFDGDGDPGTDADIEAFFACVAGDCCPACGSADFNGDGDVATDADIESFFRVLAGGAC